MAMAKALSVALKKEKKSSPSLNELMAKLDNMYDIEKKDLSSIYPHGKGSEEILKDLLKSKQVKAKNDDDEELYDDGADIAFEYADGIKDDYYGTGEDDEDYDELIAKRSSDNSKDLRKMLSKKEYKNVKGLDAKNENHIGALMDAEDEAEDLIDDLVYADEDISKEKYKKMYDDVSAKVKKIAAKTEKKTGAKGLSDLSAQDFYNLANLGFEHVKIKKPK